jgi:tetratricopeptide (TPR) repeat protein
MKDRFLIWGALGAVGLYVVATTINNHRFVPPPPLVPIESKPAAERVFRDKSGHEIRFTTPLLDAFRYAGDAGFCAELKKLPPTAAVFAEGSGASCAALAGAKPEDRPRQLAEVAATVAAATSDADNAGKDKSVTLALSALRAALDEVPAEAPQQVSEILDKFWIAQFASNEFTGYQPAFLFGAAMQVESGEAEIALCPVTGRTDCNLYVPDRLMQALTDLGRWKSDEALLLRAAEMLERTYRRKADPSKNDELDFAKDYIRTLGYAGEISAERGADHVRKGAAPLEAWLQKYEKDTSAYELEPIYGHLGAAYGRIADKTKAIGDARKAMQFDTQAYQLSMKYSSGEASWEDMSNLGDSTLLVGELERNEDYVKRALDLHRKAFEITHKGKDIEETSYMEMKLARTLQHYAAADLPSVSDDERIPLLEESVSLASGIIPFFEKSGSRVYLNLTRNVLNQAELQLAKLKETRDPPSRQTR